LAVRNSRALAAVLVGLFTAALGRLCQGQFGPAEIRRFAEAVALRLRNELTAGTDEVARVILHELGDPSVRIDDIHPAARAAIQQAVVVTAIRELGLLPNDIEEMIARAETLAEQWGISLPPYRPGLFMRWRFEKAELRWYGWQRRQQWSEERAGAFLLRRRRDLQ
jgi:hypothetical protein